LSSLSVKVTGDCQPPLFRAGLRFTMRTGLIMGTGKCVRQLLPSACC
jgi:hypothetical protein